MRSSGSINPRKQLIRHLPLDLGPLHPIPLATILLQRRDGTGTEIPDEKRGDQRRPDGPTTRQREPGPPNRVRGVIDVPGDAEQATGVGLAGVARVVLEAQALDLGQGLDDDAEREQGDADVHAGRGRVGRVGGGDGEEQGVEGVVDEVEGGDDGRAAGGHLLLAGEQDPEDLLGRRRDGHEEQQRLEGRQVEVERRDQRRRGREVVGRWRGGDGEAEPGQDRGGQGRREQDGALHERFDGPERDEGGRSQWGGTADPAGDEVAFCVAHGDGGGVLGGEVRM